MQPKPNVHIRLLKELQTAFVELKEYVDNYFANLDIQTEIDNKLDEMAESGQLAEIIAQYVELGCIYGYDTISNMAAAENLTEGSICKTLGQTAYNDGKGAFYRIRALLNTDVVDGVNIVTITDSDNLVAEKIFDAEIEELKTDINNPTDEMCTAKCAWSYSIKSYYEMIKISRAKFDLTIIPYSIYGYDGAYKYVENHPDAFYINGQLNSPTVIDGVVTAEAVPENPQYWYFFGVDANGDPKYTKDINRTLSGSSLLADGYYEAFGIWHPIVVNNIAFTPSTELNTSDPDYDYIITDKQPRSVLGYDDDYWYLITIDGRLPRSQGADFTDLVSLMQELDIPNAFNMDGGSSIQLWTSNPTTNLAILDRSRYPRGYTTNNVHSMLKFYKKGE